MKERNWDLLHKWEAKDKAIFLKKLTIEDGLRILKNLHQLSQSAIGKKEMLKFNSQKIKTLSRIHFAFGKVKV